MNTVILFFWGEAGCTDAPWQVSVTYAHGLTAQKRPEIRAKISLPVKRWVVSWVLDVRWHLCHCWEVMPKAGSQSNEEPKCRVNKSRREMEQEVEGDTSWDLKQKTCCSWWRSSETAYSLLQERRELQSQEGQICAPGSRVTVLRLSQLDIGKVNSFAKSHSAREAGEMNPGPRCHSL